MSKTDLDNLKETLLAIPEEDIKDPIMPVAVYVQEAEDLYEWASGDQATLTEAGLDVTLLEELPARAGALRYVQSVWQKEYNTFEEAQKEWSARSPEAFDLRDSLIHDFFHAYYNYPDLYSKVQAINEGATNADMLQDLSDLAVLGNSNPEPLTAINFDMTQLDTAMSTSEELAEVLAKANGMRTASNENKILRDRAYTYLKQAVDEIHRHGQYKFWRNDERRKGYSSRYMRIHRTTKSTDAEETKES